MKMNFTFLTAAGTVAFFRSDAEQAEWTQHEMNLLCTFPFMPEKIIERGMTVLFQDPATDAWQAYYIRNCQTFPGDSYQQLSAEDLAITELSTWHIAEDAQLSGVAANAALGQILTGTGWSVGSNGASGTSSGDVYRGSVWENVRMIQSNWNVHIIPRVTVDASGITGRYLDIIPGEGVFRGVRLAIDKNITDSCVTYDDSEIYTALYGYGGSYSEGEGQNRVTKEYDFSGVTWNQTSVHPAKPLGQKYLEYPAMTAQYGINGRPRFGYYQNSDIKNAEILLQKTWESLKICCKPKISINGTVTELMRFGYTDQPLRLYDMAIVDILPAGDPLYKQITQLTVNLLDATGNHVVVGDYIPNIIYINRETEEYATGGGRGRGGGTRNTKEWSEFETHILASDRNIELNAVQIDEQGEILNKAGLSIDPITGVLIYADSDDRNIGAKFNVVATGISSLVEKTGVDSLGNNETLYSKYSQTAEEVTTLVNKTGVNSLGQSETLYSKQTQTAEALTSEVARASSAEVELKGMLQIEAGKVAMVAQGDARTVRIYEAQNKFPSTGAANTLYLDTSTGKYYKWENSAYVETTPENGVNVATVVTQINADNTSSVGINADKIFITGTTKLSGYVTVENGAFKVKTTLQVGDATGTNGAVTINNGYVNAKYHQVNSGGNLKFVGTQQGEYYDLTAAKVANMVIKAAVSENTLQLWKMGDDLTSDPSITFSKATTLSDAWSGGDLTVTASPQGTTLERHLAQGATSWDGNVATVPVNYEWGSQLQYSDLTGLNVTVTGTHSVAGFNVAAAGASTTVPVTISGSTVSIHNVVNTGDSAAYYYLASSGSSGTAYIVVSGSWTCNGVSKSANSYLAAAPTALYRKGYSDGDTAGQNAIINAGGTHSVSANGTTTLNKYVTTLTVSVAAAHAVTNFDTTHALVSDNKTFSVDNRTVANNSSGYALYGSGSSADAYIVVKGSWNCDGNSKSGFSYLKAAPTALYRKGYSDGDTAGQNAIINAGGTHSVSANGTTTLNKYVTTLTVSVAGTNITPSSDISINNPTWYDSTATLPSANATLSTMGTLVNNHKNGRGYIYFNVTISGISGSKVYRLPIGSP